MLNEEGIYELLWAATRACKPALLPASGRTKTTAWRTGSPDEMIQCYITDRNLRGVNQRVEWIQIRDKQLPARELLSLTRHVISVAPESKIIVNSRMDVALAAQAHGLHLPSDSPPPHMFRKIAPAGFLIGVSCHTIDEVKRAEQESADYVLFGPVFTPISKTSGLAPRGLDALAEATSSVKIPVLALGGITRENSGDCMKAGAAGIAAISLFESC